MYTPDYNVISRHDTEFYKQDLLGIRQMEEEGRADFVAIPGHHMYFTAQSIYDLVKDIFIL